MSEKPNKIPKEFVWNDKSIADFWDYAANSPLMNLSFSLLCSPDLVKLIERRVSKEKTICDYGAGNGHLVNALLQAGYKVGAYEPSVERQKDFPEEILNSPNFLGFHTDIKYDCVVCFEVLEHLADKAIPAFYKSIDQILAENGIFIGSSPWCEKLQDNYCLCPNCHALFHRWQHMRSFTPGAMKRFLDMHGFTAVEVFHADFVNSLIFTAFRSDWLAKHLLQEKNKLES